MQIAKNSNYSGLNKKSPNFGYNYKTHKLITQKAIEQVPELEGAVKKLLAEGTELNRYIEDTSVSELLGYYSQSKDAFESYVNKLALCKDGMQWLVKTAGAGKDRTTKFVNEIADAAMMPDIMKSEIGFCTNKHFYFLPTDNKLSQSFGPESQKNNALSAYKEHLSKANDQRARAFTKSFELGMGAHFLQDMTIPMHTQRANFSVFEKFPFAGKIVDFFMHKNFETGKEIGLLSRHDELLNGYQPNYQKIKSSLNHKKPLEHLFMSNVEFSTKPELQIKRTNKQDWKNIQQECFNRAVDSTIILLKEFSENILLKNSRV